MLHKPFFQYSMEYAIFPGVFENNKLWLILGGGGIRKAYNGRFQIIKNWIIG